MVLAGLLGPNAALVSAAPGVLSKELLEVELPHLFEGEWDWQVAPFDSDCFSVAFPDLVMLRMATRSGKLFLSINNIMADIRDTALAEPKPMSMPEVCVKMWGIPPKQRRLERLNGGYDHDRQATGGG